MRFLDMGGARAAERRLRIVRRPEKGVRVSAAALEALRAAFSAWLARQARDVRRMIRGSLVSGSVGNLRALKLEIIRYFAEETGRGLSEEALEAVRAVTDAGLMRVIADTTAEENERIGQAWIDGFDARYAAAMSARLNRANRNAAIRLLGVTGDKDRVDHALSALAAWPGQRAQMMAANEACFATNEAMVAGYRAAGYKTEWQAAPSCCKICQRYDDQTITTLKPPLHKGCTCGVVKGEPFEEPLTDPRQRDIIITDEQFGEKAGKHMREWGLNPADKNDREAFRRITEDIVRDAEEVRTVKWGTNQATNVRDVPVYGYIKGEDAVLVEIESRRYITTMRNGRNNRRVQQGEVIFDDR